MSAVFHEGGPSWNEATFSFAIHERRRGLVLVAQGFANISEQGETAMALASVFPSEPLRRPVVEALRSGLLERGYKAPLGERMDGGKPIFGEMVHTRDLDKAAEAARECNTVLAAMARIIDSCGRYFASAPPSRWN